MLILNNIYSRGETENENQEEQFNNLNNMDNNENINDMDNSYNIENLNNNNEINDINDIDFNNMKYIDNMLNIDNNFEIFKDMKKLGNLNKMNNINFMIINKNVLKNDNNMNDEFIESDGQGEMNYQNNNSITLQKIMNDIEDINEHFIDLEQRFKSIEIVNKNLQKELANEKRKNRKFVPNNKNIYENSMIQGKIILEDIKKKNDKLIEKIKDLELKKKIIELPINRI